MLSVTNLKVFLKLPEVIILVETCQRTMRFFKVLLVFCFDFAFSANFTFWKLEIYIPLHDQDTESLSVLSSKAVLFVLLSLYCQCQIPIDQ